MKAKWWNITGYFNDDTFDLTLNTINWVKRVLRSNSYDVRLLYARPFEMFLVTSHKNFCFWISSGSVVEHQASGHEEIMHTLHTM